MREWIVTLHSKEDLDSFYDDMESPGGNLYIPDRQVDVANRRPISRNTHYYLTDEEAQQVSNDPRVLSVELNWKDAGIEDLPIDVIEENSTVILDEYQYVQQSNNFDKGNTLSASMKNWGLLRCVEGAQRSNWGSNGTANQTGSITVNSSGKHVDVVIVDGHIDPAHPEFAVNPDGTGGSRVNQFNWFSLNPQVTGAAPSTYVYTPYVSGSAAANRDNDHGCHVAGTVAGNTQGWARDANIFNFSPYNSSPSYTPFFIDYIRAWHNSKPINPLTGRRNPTISNHSYGSSVSSNILDIGEVYFRGTLYSSDYPIGPGFSSNQMIGWGFRVTGSPPSPVTVSWLIGSSARQADIADAIADGIIYVGSAGNNNNLIANPGTADYENYVRRIGFSPSYYMRGSHSAYPGNICVGAVGTTVLEDKASYSGCGPRVDVFAPGSMIMSSVHTSSLAVVVSDPRNPTYKFTKISGTSMATPQVTGILSCLAETWPRMRQEDAINWLVANSKEQVYDNTAAGPGLDNTLSLKGAPPRYLYFLQPRKDSGSVYPNSTQGVRPTKGQAFPRPKIYRFGS